MNPPDPRLLIISEEDTVLPGEVLRRCGVTLAGRMGSIRDVLGMGADLRLDVILWFDPPLADEGWVAPCLDLARLRPTTGLVLVPGRPEAVGPLEAAILDRRERGQLHRVTAAGRSVDDLIRGICRALADAGLGRLPQPGGSLSMLRPGSGREQGPAGMPGSDSSRGAGIDRPPPADAGRARIITVFGPKGGVGKTTIAVGLATLAAAGAAGVVIVDLDLEAADVAVHLDLLDAPDLIDVLPRIEAAPQMLPRFGGTPLAVVPGPVRPQLAEAVRPDTAQRLLDSLAATYRWVIVDVGARLGDEVAYRAIAAADRLVFVVTPDASSLRTARLLVDHAEDLGLTGSRLLPVVNQHYEGALLDPRRISDFLGIEVRHAIPLDRGAVDASILNGRPLVLERPAHPVARALVEVARSLDLPVPGAVAGEPPRRGFLRWRELLPWKA